VTRQAEEKEIRAEMRSRSELIGSLGKYWKVLLSIRSLRKNAGGGDSEQTVCKERKKWKKR
jgi:hypothetical protein